MINEERVRELYQMACYDAKKAKTDDQMGQYYMWDYISKELIKSFFSGSIAFVLLVILWGMSDLENVTAIVNNLQLADSAVRLVVLYIAFLAVYLFVTMLVYCIRYVGGRKRLRKYAMHIKKVRRMYQREDRLKS